MGVKNIQGELKINDEVVATQDWVTRQQKEPAIIATFNITYANTTITLKNLKGMTEIDWGDGIINSELSHTYVNTGEYKCKIYDITSIGSSAFQYCDSLTSVVVGNSMTSISDQAFYSCDSLTSVVIGNGVTSIGLSVFSHCSSLTSITIPDSVMSIGYGAFSYCSSLTSIIFKNPVSITYNSQYPWFTYCPSLTHIYVPYGCKQVYIDKWTAGGMNQDILDKIVESDREAMMSDVDAFKTEIQEQLVSKTDYLGTVTDIPDFPDAGAGDYCRVSAEFIYNIADGEVAHVGDILIAVNDNPTQSITDWDLVHTELNSATLVTVDGEAQVSWEANTKLDKVTSTDGTNKVYVAAANGSQTMVPISSSIVGNAIVQRTANGYIRVPSEQVDGNYAVSQTYVADNFVKKLGAGTGWRVYGVYADGTEQGFTVVNSATEATIPWRGIGGTVFVGTPTEDAHATNKKYVADNFVAKAAGSADRIMLYGIDKEGNQITVGTSPSAANGGMVPLYNPSGNINVALPKNGNQAANRYYVDENFVAKRNTGTQSAVYVSTYNADTQTYSDTYVVYATGEQENTIARRGTGGTLAVGAPTANAHATTKSYVDTNFVAKSTVVPNEAKAWTIPQRTYNGRVIVGTPEENSDAATKGYVDDLIASLQAQIDELKSN